jgi:hypothetical protein
MTLEGRHMQIACLGWGSLVWNPSSLPIHGEWFGDGPFLPLEFARQSSRGRITLVITSVPDRVRALWALLTSSDLQSAKKVLAHREGVIGHIEREIGFWTPSGSSGHRAADIIGDWASNKSLDAVVWTALEPGLRGHRGTLPNQSEVLGFLRKLPQHQRRAAEEYIRNSPLQIDTRYRRQIEKELGWSPSALAISASAPPGQ